MLYHTSTLEPYSIYSLEFVLPNSNCLVGCFTDNDIPIAIFLYVTNSPNKSFRSTICSLQTLLLIEIHWH